MTKQFKEEPEFHKLLAIRDLLADLEESVIDSEEYTEGKIYLTAFSMVLINWLKTKRNINERELNEVSKLLEDKYELKPGSITDD